MAYSAEVVRRARERLAQAKENRESENRQHLAEAYARVPRIQEIDMQLRYTMAKAAQAAFRQGSDGREEMEQIRSVNLQLQKERAALAASYFEEGYLDDSPICECCGGSGYVGSTMCECLQELCRQEQKREVSILTGGKETFSQFRLDYYSDEYNAQIGTSPRKLMERNFQAVRRYALTFDTQAENMLFVGGTGLGKTFLAACVARTVADRGYSVGYETAAHLFSKLEQAKFTPTEDNRREAAKLTECDLLIVDDLGTEMPGQFVTAALFSLLNDRLIARKPMLITTNLNVEEMSRRYSPQIASRIYGGFIGKTFVGEDIRIKKSMEW